MSNSTRTTVRMIQAYFQEASPIMFFSSFFRTPAENFHNSEEVEIDIERSDEDIATVITDLSTGGVVNSFDQYTNKRFKPPVYKEIGTLTAFDLLSRTAGDDPFKDVSFQANATRRAFRIFRKLENKVRRAVELMASQVLQTAVLTLRDEAGNAAYSLNFAPKATHFPTASVAWNNASSTKRNDIDALAQVIRTDGLIDPNVLIFGGMAWEEWITDTEIQTLLDNRRIGVGEIRPESRGEGATFQGFIWIGNYRYEMWTYTGRYKDPADGVVKKYLNDEKVIMMADGACMDLTYGSIPLIQRQGPGLSYLPDRMTSTGGGFGMTTNSWVNGEGTHLNVSAGTRPLTIPTAIDQYGCLDVNIT